MKKIRCLIYNFTVLCSLIVLSILPSACSKDPIREKIITPPDTTKVATYENGIFIVNEGNYNWGNASVTYLDNKDNTVIQDIFNKSNNRSLGDVAESMTISGNLGYLLINNSNRIEVVSLKDFKSVSTITGLHSPRYLEVVDSSKAYATNLQNYISVINLKTNTVSSTIQTTSWTENLIRYDRFMLVTSIGRFSEPTAVRKAQILVIDTQTDAIVDSIQSGKEPIGIVIDKKQKVWVLCSGGYDNFEAPSLLRINPELRVIEKVFTFPDPKAVPSRLCMNPTGDTIYFLMGGVYQMPVTSAALPAQPLIRPEGRLFYGLNIHPATGRIYVSDAKDYVQNGTAYQYDVTGSLVKSYTTGRIPGSFCFTKNSTK
ncbi:MAG: YncE family protein [Bacteroidetes bacterium]|nr:YncE family protein [Bacteroidota bacterium]